MFHLQSDAPPTIVNFGQFTSITTLLMVDISTACEMANLSAGRHYVIISNDLMIIPREKSGLQSHYLSVSTTGGY